MELYSLDVADLTNNANRIKETILGGLEREGLLKKPADEIAAAYTIVIMKPGFFGSLFSKLKGQDEKETLRIIFLKQV